MSVPYKALLIWCIFSLVNGGTHLHIIHGTSAKANSHPWLLSIEKINDTNWCGASLLRIRDGLQKSDIGLSASHCICGNSAAKVKIKGATVLAGNIVEHQRDAGEQSREIINAICHPNFDKKIGFGNDVALFKFSAPIDFTDFIKPIDLLDENDIEMPGDKCIVAGWGAVELGIHKVVITTPELQEIEIQIAPDSDCETNFKDSYNSSTMLCAKPPANKIGQPCKGDSGGPLVCNFDSHPVQMGIVGFGDSKCKGTVASIFTKLSTFRIWIKETMEKLTSL